MKARLFAAGTALALALSNAAWSADADKKEPTTNMDKAVERTKEVIDDSAITGKIKAEYAKDKTVSAMKIHVKTMNGVVSLSGTAKSKEEVSKAVEIAKGVHGVTSVKNAITVGSAKK